MSLELFAKTPYRLWVQINKTFLSERCKTYVDEDTGISVQSFNNHFHIEHWDPNEMRPMLKDLLHKMGYSKGGTKITQLTSKYLDWDQYDKLKEKLKEYRDKDRFTLGMTFRNSPARSGGCLTGMHIVKYANQEEAVFYAKIVEVPKKFAADLNFFNLFLRDIGFSGPVRVVSTCVFFWKVTAPLLIPVLGMDSFQYAPFRNHVQRKIAQRAYLASPEYKYRNEARTWEYLKPIIDKMVEKGELKDG